MSGPRSRRPSYPVLLQDVASRAEQIAQANLLMAGKFNNVDDFTLLAGEVEMLIKDSRASVYSFIDIVPLDAIAVEMATYAIPGTREFTVRANVIQPIWAGMIANDPAVYSSSDGNPVKIVDFVSTGQSDHTNAIVLDPPNGNALLNFAGDYRINFRTSFLAAGTQNYSWWIARNGSFAFGDAAERRVDLLGPTEEVQISIDFIFSAQPGDVISAYIENHFVSPNQDDDVLSSYMEITHVGSTAPIPSDEDANFRYAVVG